jgi:Calcineurin-like phosphoesterase
VVCESKRIQFEPAGPRDAQHHRIVCRALALAVWLAAAGCSAELPEDIARAAGSARDVIVESAPADWAGMTATARGLKVALLGDQGVNVDAHRVLQLIAQERADGVIHMGDLAYEQGSPSEWDEQVTSVLGADFPYFAAIGNHDRDAWFEAPGFAALLLERLARVPDAQCFGDYGIHSSCSFRGLDFVLSGVGTFGDDHELFLEAALADSDAIFRLCIWHKNQRDMQVGEKPDEVGWEAYRICAKHGAAVITGHEHSYARSLTLSAIGDRDLGHGAIGVPERIELAPGNTVVVVNGLGGKTTRAWSPAHAEDTWWASIYARNYQLQNGVPHGKDAAIAYGALFVEFNVSNDPGVAKAYFKTVDGQIQDEFMLQALKPAPD